MNPDYQAFLEQQQALIQNNSVVSFANTPAHHCTLHPLAHYGILQVSGDDASNFLQNLLSNDIRLANGEQAQYSSFNTAKGRMLFSLLIWSQNNNYYLQLPQELLEPLRKKLSMYVLRSKVKLEISKSLYTLGIHGENATQQLEQAGFKLPQHNMEQQQNLIRLDSNRYLLICPQEQLQTTWQQLSLFAQATSDAHWDWLNIQQGIPVICAATQEQFVPQMLNFDCINGIHFKKGCYPGQEIVARTQYLGKIKRRMYLAHIDSDTPPQAGDLLVCTEMEQQSCGMLANCSPAPNGGYDVLAVILNQAQQQQSIHLRSLDGPTLRFGSLPYTVD